MTNIKDLKKEYTYFLKRKSSPDTNNDRKRIKFTSGNFNKSSTQLQNVQLLMNNKTLDETYGFNIDENGIWRYGNNKLVLNNDNSIRIGNKQFKMTPGLFELVFHAKPLHYTKTDLNKYKDLLIKTNVYIILMVK